MRRSDAGFTLLEVMVALTITAMALGALFGVIGGNKQLAWRAEDALVRSMQVRSLINVAQLGDEDSAVFLSIEHAGLDLLSGEQFEEPERKTEPTLDDLRGFRIETADGETLAAGTYWLHQELPTTGVDAATATTQGDAPPQNAFEQAVASPQGPSR
jgi:prepilin-type N-terminal cleavage/methylation domain-containing protein